MRFVWILPFAAAAFSQPRPFEAIVQAATAAIPRITEADVEVLRDGTLLLAYTEFTGGAAVTGAPQASPPAPAATTAGPGAHRASWWPTAER